MDMMKYLIVIDVFVEAGTSMSSTDKTNNNFEMHTKRLTEVHRGWVPENLTGNQQQN